MVLNQFGKNTFFAFILYKLRSLTHFQGRLINLQNKVFAQLIKQSAISVIERE